MNEIKEFSFSNISFEDLDNIVSIEKQYDLSVFRIWFKDREIGKSDLEFLEIFHLKYGEIFFGAIITGVIWDFVILKKMKNRYFYTISQNFDSTKLKNLLFIKDEILDLVKTERRVNEQYFF